MADALANFADSLVATAPSPASSGTSLVMSTGDGANFPTPPFNAVVCPANVARPSLANSEIIRCTAKSSDTLSTIVRAQEGTSARSIAVGDRIYIPFSKKYYDDINTSIAAKQDADSDLTDFAALSGNNKMIYRDGSGIYQVSDLTAAGRAILDDADATAQRATLDVYSTSQITFITSTYVDRTIATGKGDIFAASANDSPAILAAGANELVPIYDSTQTPGLKTGIPLAAVRHKTLVANTVGLIPASTAAGNYGFNMSGAAGTTVGSNANGVFIVDAANDWTLSGRTPKFVTRLLVGTNGTAPAITFTAGLSSLNSASGGANAFTYGWASQTAGTTAAVASPSANSWTQNTSSPFSLPSDGPYILTVLTSGAMAATNPKAVVHAYVYAVYT